MHRSRVIVIIGAIVALLPLLGFPNAWESFFQVVAGLSIVGLSVWAQIDRKLSQKAKAQMRARRVTPALLEAPVAEEKGEGSDSDAPKLPPVTPTFGKRLTDFYPKTGQPGRRATDLKATVPREPEPLSSEEETLI